MTAAGWIFRLSFRQLVQRKRAIALALLTALPGIVLAIASTSVDDDELVSLFHDLNFGLYILIGVAITGLLTASSAFGEELRAATISYVVVKPVPRWIIAAAVTVAATSATLLLAGIGLAVNWIVAVITIGDVGLGVAPLRVGHRSARICSRVRPARAAVQSSYIGRTRLHIRLGDHPGAGIVGAGSLICRHHCFQRVRRLRRGCEQ
jgi:ABC-type transport system involved in cytochrome c biogenesis permease component